jgi:hypothetical protein
MSFERRFQRVRRRSARRLAALSNSFVLRDEMCRFLSIQWKMSVVLSFHLDIYVT